MTTPDPAVKCDRDGFVVPETVERTREIIGQIEVDDMMLEYEITGTPWGAGEIDTVRRFDDHPGELQVRPWWGGRPIWVPEEDAVDELRGRPLRLVDAEPAD